MNQRYLNDVSLYSSDSSLRDDKSIDEEDWVNEDDCKDDRS